MYDYLVKIKKLIITLLFILFWSHGSYSKDLFHYVAKKDPPKLIVGNTGFNDALNDEINDLSIYLGIGKGEKPIYSSFNQLLINSDVDGEIEFNDKNYFIVSGCRPRSCPEKGYLWVDKKNKIVLGAMIHYFLNDKKDTDNGYLLVISKKFKSFEKLPKKFKKDLDKWLSRLTTWDYVNNNGNKPLKPSVIRFINSENIIKIIK